VVLVCLLPAGLARGGAIPILLAIAWYKDGRDKLFNIISRADLPVLAACGFCGLIVSQCLFNWGTMLSSASDAGLMQPLNTIFTTIMAVCLGTERASWLKAGGIVGAVVGCTLIALVDTFLPPVSSPSSAGASPAVPSTRLWGLLCFVGNCFAFSVYIILQQPLLKRFPPLTLLFWTFLFGGSGCIVVALCLADRVPWTALPAISWVAVAYSILFSSVLAFFTFSYASQTLPSSLCAAAICLCPLFSSVLASIFLGERITYIHALGGLCICAGVLTVVYVRNRDAQEDALTKEAVVAVDDSTSLGANASATHHSEDGIAQTQHSMHFPSSAAEQATSTVSVRAAVVMPSRAGLAVTNPSFMTRPCGGMAGLRSTVTSDMAHSSSRLDIREVYGTSSSIAIGLNIHMHADGRITKTTDVDMMDMSAAAVH
jgi:drug/metabolite transporter (DMT)-like permease